MNAIIQHSVLIVSGTQKGAAIYTELLSPREFAPMTTALSGGDARRAFAAAATSLWLSTHRSRMNSGTSWQSISQKNSFPVSWSLQKRSFSDQVNDEMVPFGILTVQKPLSRPLFYQALHLLIATQNRWQRFDRENQKLRTKMEEVRIVARAKCILVEYLRMSEQQAHRYIEKQAMDMRTSKKDVAENILKTYT